MIRIAKRPSAVAPPSDSDTAGQIAALLGDLLLRPLPSGRFAAASTAPAWFARLWPGLSAGSADLRAVSLFLDAFLDDAEAFWRSGEDGPLASGVWSETAPDGTLVPLEALALRLASGPVLLLRPPAIPVDVYQHTLQQSREQGLAFDALRRTLQQQEDALACLLHDVGTPIASVRASLEFLRQDGLVADAGADLLAIAQAQTERLQSYVRGFLDTISAPHRPPMPLDGPLPDLYAVARQVVEMQAPAFQSRRVALVVERPAGCPPDCTSPVLAERVRLERVLVNLLDNALRHSPPGTTVRVRLLPDAHGVRLEVADEGAGVPEAFVPQLFRRFVRGPGVPGTAGLGLYFCRMTVEGWGGDVGYRPSPTGGAVFWCRFVRPAPSLPPPPFQP